MAAPERKPIISLPDDERGRSASDIRRFDRALADLGKPRQRPLTLAQIDAKIAYLASIENEPAAAKERAWLEATRDETAELERLRGGSVTVAPSGQMRANDRDGLFALLRIANPITAQQWDAGMKYREGYELREEDMRSGLGGDGGGGAHNNNSYVRSRLIRAAKLATAGRIETEVRLLGFRTGDAKLIDALEMVAGAGATLTAFCEAHKRGFPAGLRGLKMALDVADSVVRGK